MDLVAQAPFAIAAVALWIIGMVARVTASRSVQPDIWADAVIAILLACPLVLLFSGLVRWPGYGRQSLWAHLLVAMGIDRTPRERGASPHTAYVFDVSRSSQPHQNVRRRLRHKAICTTPSVVSAIGDWIERGLRPDAAER